MVIVLLIVYVAGLAYDSATNSFILVDQGNYLIRRITYDGMLPLLLFFIYLHTSTGYATTVTGKFGGNADYSFTPGVGSAAALALTVVGITVSPLVDRLYYISDCCGVRVLCMYFEGRAWFFSQFLS